MQVLILGMRALQLYLPNNPIYQKARDNIKAGFEPVWEECSELELRINESDFIRPNFVEHNTPNSRQKDLLLFVSKRILLTVIRIWKSKACYERCLTIATTCLTRFPGNCANILATRFTGHWYPATYGLQRRPAMGFRFCSTPRDQKGRWRTWRLRARCFAVMKKKNLPRSLSGLTDRSEGKPI